MIERTERRLCCLSLKVGQLIGLSVILNSMGSCDGVCADLRGGHEATAKLTRLPCVFDFDCLDGAKVDPKTGALSLFGHRRDPGKLIRIAYDDYLATALVHKTPMVSVSDGGSGVEARATIRAKCREELGLGLSAPFDRDTRLTKGAAWILQQAGVPTLAGFSHWDTLSATFRATGQDDKAELLNRMQACATVEGEESQTAFLELYKTLGISRVYGELQTRIKLGKISPEEAADFFNPIYLRAVERELGGNGERYATLYETDRRTGKPSAEVMKTLVHREMEVDMTSLFIRTRNDLLRGAPVISAPPWLAAEALEHEGARTKFFDVPPSSWMARTMYQADVLLKSLAWGNRIRRLVPGFQTYDEFMEATGQAENNPRIRRIAIECGAFEISESTDGTLMKFLAAPMKIVISRIEYADGVQTDLDDDLTEARNAYAAMLTDQYDELSRHFPTLQKLQECAKVIALARWLDSRGIRASTPSGARLFWTAPASIPYTIAIRLKPDRAQPILVDFVGGVVLNPEQAWRISRHPQLGTPEPDVLRTIPSQARDSSRQWEMYLRGRLSEASDTEERVGLEVDLAQVLSDRGDQQGAMKAMDRALKIAPENDVLWLLTAMLHDWNGDTEGAVLALNEYVGRVPDNLPAQRVLERLEQSPKREANPNLPRGTDVPLEPFVWTNSIRDSFYSTDERAPELPDLHIQPFVTHSLPPPPAIPDFVSVNPEVHILQLKREALIAEYLKTSPERASEIRNEIRTNDREILRVAKDYAVPSPPPVPDFVALNPEIHALQVRREALVADYKKAPPETAMKISIQIHESDKNTAKVVKTYSVSVEEDEPPASALRDKEKMEE